MLLDAEKRELSTLRINHARQCLSDAEVMRETESYKSAANRIYYAVFHAMRAVLILDGFDSKKHSGIISEFQRLYIKTGIFAKETSTVISSAFDIRTNSDYNDFYIVSKADVDEQLESARSFVELVSAYLDSVFTPNDAQ